VGHLVAVDVQEADGAPGWVPAGFEAVFTTEERSYYRCAQSQELDQSLGDVHSLLHEREHAVLRSVEGHVLELQAELGLVVEAVGELDVIFALAETAQVRLAAKGRVRPVQLRATANNACSPFAGSVRRTVASCVPPSPVRPLLMSWSRATPWPK